MITAILATLIGCLYLPLWCIGILINWVVNRCNPFRSSQWHALSKTLEDKKYGVHKIAYLKTSYGNINLHYVESGNPNKPLIVFLHGFPDCWFGWRHQIVEFNKTHHVVAVDMRGYGLSDKPQDVKSYYVKYLEEDITMLVKYLGKSSFHLIGHDWGGVIGWCLHNNVPEMITSFTCIDGPHPTAMLKVLTTSLKQFFKSWYIFFFQISWIPEFTFSMDDYSILRKVLSEGMKTAIGTEVDDLIANGSIPGVLRASINYYRAFLRYPSRLSSRKSSITYPPCLVLWGEKDKALGLDVAKSSLEFASLRTGCIGELEVINGARHWPHVDEISKVNSMIRKFIELAEEKKIKSA